MELVEAVAAIVPNDFTFCFAFTARGAGLSVDFEDGSTFVGYEETKEDHESRSVNGMAGGLAARYMGGEN